MPPVCTAAGLQQGDHLYKHLLGSTGSFDTKRFQKLGVKVVVVCLKEVVVSNTLVGIQFFF